MDGFEARTSGATSVHDPLHARVILAEGAHGGCVALVVADLLQISAGVQQHVAEQVLLSTGIPREHLQLIATHTHSGPIVPPGSEVETMVSARIASAVADAWTARKDALIAVGVGTVSGIGANRRPLGGPVDDRVTVVRFDYADGGPAATLVNYGCHPTTLGPNNTCYSADYPGVLCAELAAEIGGLVVFTTGPQGDVNPGGYSPEASMVGVVAPWRTFESAVKYGHSLTVAAKRVYGTLRPRPTDEVWGKSHVVELARKRLPGSTVARQAADTAAASAKSIQDADLSKDATYHALVAAAYGELLASQASMPDRDEPVRTRISALRFGPFTHLGVQGELFVELGQRIRTALGEETVCIAALCDGTIGYIPTTAAFGEGGYEPNASLIRPGEGERLANAMISLVRQATDQPARAIGGGEP
jgi:hypothetical protein